MNELEKSIIQFIVSSYPDDFKSTCISELIVSEREYTGSGVIVCFEQRGNVVTSSKTVNFIGPLIESSVLELGAETVLSVKNGRLDCLDILVRGSGDIKAVSSYRLIDEDVNFVCDSSA
ncbi:hypothetical protein ACEV9E_23300 [Vibrio parahaemolyticus]|uniref:hypothetical protein n=1 Tax=Vibrio parahaemolyticus TaxID=670 RepID=UPI00111D3DE2|nr:hypothetical protein [Vibrio parahaemolyticus]EGQ8808835.1 hypothetical protein [Vibrio parahaemolyticus]EGQ8893127.1 hypothetical protein [Vibrio parahaemolyticus]EGQ8967216.1 hypothetical protein [Vibrio parahaemolyticus]EGR2854861.1 hypothetical protein [Vibrio parahaemolyticus]EGR3169389.1 hypothetical protein [Vibrio parahaemolyticus]